MSNKLSGIQEEIYFPRKLEKNHGYLQVNKWFHVKKLKHKIKICTKLCIESLK
jgi:hypothetical protein